MIYVLAIRIAFAILTILLAKTLKIKVNLFWFIAGFLFEGYTLIILILYYIYLQIRKSITAIDTKTITHSTMKKIGNKSRELKKIINGKINDAISHIENSKEHKNE